MKALLVHSATAALEMAALLLEIEPGDEVVMPSFAFVSSANAFVLRGGVPVFVRQAAVMLPFTVVITSLGLTIRTENVLLESDEGVLVNLDVRRAGSAKEARSGYLQEASVQPLRKHCSISPLVSCTF